MFGRLLKILLVPCGLLVFAAWQSGILAAPADDLGALPIATSSRTPTVTPRPSATPTLPPPATRTLAPSATSIPVTTITPTPTQAVSAQPASDGITRTVNVPILMYHYISAPPSLADSLRVGLSVPPEKFDAQMNLLAAQGYRSVTLLDIYTYLQNGQALPANPVVITFDDGYLDNYQYAYPILKKYGFVGTFFILSGPIDNDNPNYMTWNMVKELSDSGMDIELHSRDHFDLRNRPNDFLVYQLVGGRQTIEAHTGRPIHFMAYPSGKYDAAVLRVLASADFWGAVTTQDGKLHSIIDALIWARVRISGRLSLEGFAKTLGLRWP